MRHNHADFSLWSSIAILLFMAVSASAAAKPNLIIILVDDMGYGDIGCYGSTVNRTPNCDRMAAEGMKLTSFYAAPVCTPSRAQVLTGCYAKRVSLPAVIFPAAKVGLSAKEHTIAELLRAQGYATQCIGKWHVGDQVEFLPTRRGFDHYLGLPYSNDMQGEWDGSPDAPAGKRNPPLPLVRDEVVIDTMNGAKQERIEQILKVSVRLKTGWCKSRMEGYAGIGLHRYSAHRTALEVGCVASCWG